MSTFKVGDLEKWQPKEGEWCLFLIKGKPYPLLAKFDKIVQIHGIQKYAVIDSYITFDYCEPFIGELPSFLKDK